MNWHVEFTSVQCAIQRQTAFKGVANICFPHAAIVSDKYHVVRQSGWTLENVRKADQKKLSNDWRKYCKRSKYLLLKIPKS